MGAPLLEKKRSSRWKLFKKRRKKRQEGNDLQVEKQSSSPPRSDATSATSGGAGLLRSITKKQSKRNLKQEEEEESVYLPPEIELSHPSFDVISKEHVEVHQFIEPKLTVSEESVPTPTPSLPSESDTAVPVAEVAKAPSEETQEKKVAPEKSAPSTPLKAPEKSVPSTPLKVDTPSTSKPQAEDTPAVVESSDSSPSAFLRSLREAAASPALFLADLDPFGFPSSPQQSSDNVKDDDDITWNSFLQPFPASATEASRPSAKSHKDSVPSSLVARRAGGNEDSPKPTDRKPVATIMERATVGKPQSPVETNRKSVASTTSEANTSEKVPTRDQSSPKSTKRKPVASTMENAAIGRTKVTDAPATTVKTNRKSVASTASEASTSEKVPTREQSSPKSTERKAVASIMEKAAIGRTKVTDASATTTVKTNRKSVASTTSEASTSEKVPTREQSSPKSTKRKAVASIMEKAAIGRTKVTDASATTTVKTNRKSVASTTSEASTSEKVPAREQSSPQSTERKPVASIMDKAAAIGRTKVTNESATTTVKQMDPPGAKPDAFEDTEQGDAGSKSVLNSMIPGDLFGDDSIFSALSWEAEEIVNQSIASSGDIFNLSSETEVSAKQTESIDVQPATVPTTGLKKHDSDDLSLSLRQLIIRRMAASRMAKSSSSVSSTSSESQQSQNDTRKTKDPAPVSTPKTLPTVRLEKKAIDAALAHKAATRRRASPAAGRARVTKPTITTPALDSISELPNPSQLIRKASSFDVKSQGIPMTRQRSNSFDLPRSQFVGSKVEDYESSSRGTELYLKRHQRHVVDRYESIEHDDDTTVEEKMEDLTVSVKIDEGHEGQIEVVIPGEPKDALCKFEAHYSEASLHDSTASCTDETGDDLYGDGSWGDTVSSDGSTDYTTEESRSFVTNDSRTNYTDELRSRFTESSTVLTTDGSKMTAVTSDYSRFYDESGSHVTDDNTYDSRSYTVDESFISRDSTTATNNYISDDDLTGYEYGSGDEEDEPVDNYFWENIAERLFVPGSRK